jgi:hypothetical protein
VFGRLSGCTEGTLRQARTFAASLAANMGGTEIGGALQAARKALEDVGRGDILLVTDGEVSQWQPVVDEARRAGHRVFTVGVGHAVSEAFVRALARDTGGACELVSPGEGMAERIVRQFERMRAPRASRVSIRWPHGFRDASPVPDGVLFEGDTLVAWARTAERTPEARVVLEVEWDDGHLQRQELVLQSPAAEQLRGMPSTVARLAAAARLGGMPREEATSVAVQYQLVTPFTNWLVVAERAESEKATSLPDLRKVKHTVAAGYGGLGTRVVEARSFPAAGRQESLAQLPDHMFMDMDMTSPSIRRAGDATPPAAESIDACSRLDWPSSWLSMFRKLAASRVSRGTLTPSTAMRELHALHLARGFEAVFAEAARIGLREEDVAAVVMHAFLALLRLELPMRSEDAAVAPFLREVECTILADLARLGESAREGGGAPSFAGADRYVRDAGGPDLRERLARIPALLEQVEWACRRMVEAERGAAVV